MTMRALQAECHLNDYNDVLNCAYTVTADGHERCSVHYMQHSLVVQTVQPWLNKSA